MKNNSILPIAFFSITFIASLSATAQIMETNSRFKVTADLESHYVWRGSMATGSPTPTLVRVCNPRGGIVGIGVRYWGRTKLKL